MAGTSICCHSAGDMVLNPTLDVLSVITSHSWDLQRDNHILIYLNVFNRFLYAVRGFQVARDVTAIIYPPNITSYVGKNNRHIVTNFASVIFNTQVKAFKHDVHLCTFRNFMLASKLQNDEALKGIEVEANMITVALLQYEDVSFIS